MRHTPNKDAEIKVTNISGHILILYQLTDVLNGRTEPAQICYPSKSAADPKVAWQASLVAPA